MISAEFTTEENPEEAGMLLCCTETTIWTIQEQHLFPAKRQVTLQRETGQEDS